MANLESILAETNKSYDQSRNALNEQINAISGDLEAQKNRINAQYAQQGKNLDNQRNWQAQASSMAASRNGGSFGGSAEIANKKYYQQAYVPAVTQMQTNQANDLSSAESQANSNRLSLQQTLAQLNDEANRYALQRYDAAVQAERDEAYRQAQLALQREANRIAIQQAATPKYGYAEDTSGGTQFFNNNTGKGVTFGTYAANAGAKNTVQLLKLAQNALNDYDYNRLVRIVNAQSNTKHSQLKVTGKTDGSAMKYLGKDDQLFMGRLGLGF